MGCLKLTYSIPELSIIRGEKAVSSKKSAVKTRRDLVDEIKGEGSSVNFEFRMHDPRLGRFFAIDPLKFLFPSNSPYSFSHNRVIDCIELEGREPANFEATKSAIAVRMGTARVITQTDYDQVMTGIRERGYALHSEIIYLAKDPSKIRQVSDGTPTPLGGMSIQVRDDVYEKAQQDGEDRIAAGRPGVTDDAPGAYRVIIPAENMIEIVDQYPPLPPPVNPPTVIFIDCTDDSDCETENKEPKKPTLSASQKANLSQVLSDGSIFRETSTSGPTSRVFEIAKGSYANSSIQDMMKKYKQYDLSGVKVTINITVGTADRNEIVPPKYGYTLYKQAVDELVKSGISRGNIKPGVINRKTDQYGPDATFILK